MEWVARTDGNRRFTNRATEIVRLGGRGRRRLTGERMRGSKYGKVGGRGCTAYWHKREDGGERRTATTGTAARRLRADVGVRFGEGWEGGNA